jgi:hypothetical protein
MEKSYYVYYSYEEWGRGYIGSRACDCLPEEDVKYFGSFSDKTFKPTQKIILQVFNTLEEAMEAEVILHDFYQVDINPHFANRAKQTSKKFCFRAGTIHKGRKHSEETRRKIGAWSRGRKRSEETRRRISEGQLGKKVSSETKAKLSKALRGRVLDDEWKRKLSRSQKGKPKSTEWRQKIGLAQKGRKCSEEELQRLRTMNSGRKWFNNGHRSTLAYECPPGFVPGRLKLGPMREAQKITSSSVG